MLTEVKNNLRFIALSLKYNIKACFEYKKSFIIQTIFMCINNGFFLIFWNVVFGINGGTIRSLELNDIYYMWAIAAASYGLARFLFGGISELNRYIIEGTLDTYLLQPKNMILNIAMSKNDYGGFGDVLYGIILGLYISNSVFTFLQFIFYVILGMIITMSCMLMIRLLALVLGDVEQIVSIYENSLFTTLSVYPYEIFGNFIKVIMFTIVPVVYIQYFPRLLLKDFCLPVFLAIILATIFFATLATIVFYKAMKKYESGNNIAMKE